MEGEVVIDTTGISLDERGNTVGTVTMTGHVMTVEIREHDGFTNLTCSCGFAGQAHHDEDELELDEVHRGLFTAVLDRTFKLMDEELRSRWPDPTEE